MPIHKYKSGLKKKKKKIYGSCIYNDIFFFPFVSSVLLSYISTGFIFSWTIVEAALYVV